MGDDNARAETLKWLSRRFPLARFLEWGNRHHEGRTGVINTGRPPCGVGRRLKRSAPCRQRSTRRSFRRPLREDGRGRATTAPIRAQLYDVISIDRAVSFISCIFHSVSFHRFRFTRCTAAGRGRFVSAAARRRTAACRC